MDGPVEELEPLFDYSRVQPVDLISLDEDDSLEAFPLYAGCKRKNNGPAEEENKGKKQHSVVNLEDEDEDWLAPPPKMATAVTKFEEDKILQELRLKKQELVSMAQSAESVLKAVMEDARKEHSCAVSGADSTLEEGSAPAKLQPERQKIIISIQDKDGSKQFRIFKDDKLEKLFKMYAEKSKLEMSNLAFTFDGDKVPAGATPITLGLEEDDMIEVHHKA